MACRIEIGLSYGSHEQEGSDTAGVAMEVARLLRQPANALYTYSAANDDRVSESTIELSESTGRVVLEVDESPKGNVSPVPMGCERAHCPANERHRRGSPRPR